MVLKKILTSKFGKREQNLGKRKKWIITLSVCFVLLVLGSIAVLAGFIEVSDTQNDIPDSHTIPLDPTNLTPVIDDTYVWAITTDFKTNDIFSVNNEIVGQTDIYVNNTQNIKQVVTIALSGSPSTPIPHDQHILNKTLQFYFENNMVVKGKPKILQNHTVYELNFTYNADSEGTRIMPIFLQTIDYAWHSYNINFPTIAPASALIELKNSKVVEGLTWVIVGFIPIGIVAEFLIEFTIEHHFYRKEGISNKKTEPWSCDWFPDKIYYP